LADLAQIWPRNEQFGYLSRSIFARELCLVVFTSIARHTLG
jgi:hypothetical protein